MTISNSERQYYIERINSQLAQIHASVLTSEVNLNTRFDIWEAKMAGELQRVVDEVANLKTVGEGVVTTLDNLAGQIDALKNDPAQLTRLAEDTRNLSTAFAEAIKRDTRASDEPAPQA
jgi:hypothetical protein